MATNTTSQVNVNISKQAADILIGYVDEASERAQSDEDIENLTIAWKALGVEVDTSYDTC